MAVSRACQQQIKEQKSILTTINQKWATDNQQPAATFGNDIRQSPSETQRTITRKQQH
jgi:hypothetical protein